jgi:pilus assembly protein Flp/PilA
MLRHQVTRSSRNRALAQPRERSMETTMYAFLNNLNTLAKDERGVTALEYGLIAGLVAVVIVTSVTSLGTKLAGTFTTIVAALP